jgi:hypothetical protein
MSFLCHPTYILLGIERCLKLGPESKEDLQTEMERVAYTDRALSDNIFFLFLTPVSTGLASHRRLKLHGPIDIHG